MLKDGKQFLLHMAGRAGILEAVADSRWRRRRLLIVCYHSVSIEQEHLWRPPLYFSPDAFEDRLRLIERNRCTVLPLAEAIQRLREDSLPPRSIVLTFDDGMFDFHLHVRPMLLRRGWPATVYASTYYLEKELPIFPLLCSYLLWQGKERTLPAGLFGLDRDQELSSPAERQQSWDSIIRHADAESMDAAARDGLSADLADALGIDYAALRRNRLFELMKPAEIHQIATEGFDVQLHTHRHRTPRDEGLFLKEIRENRERLEAMTGRPATHFCYPSGVHYPEFLPWLAQEKVESATTCIAGFSGPDTDPLLLPRLVDVCSLSEVEVEGWLAGPSAWLPRRKVTFG